MKRELAILFGVLGPFAVLVALGFLYTSTSTPPEPLPTPVNEPSRVVDVPVTSESSRPAPQAAGSGAEANDGTGGPVAPVAARPVTDAGVEDEPLPPEVAAPLRAITPEFTRCFADVGSRAQAPVDVTLRFRPTRDGGFSDTELTSTWQDPYLTACLTDVLEEVGWAPTGRETFERATHVFHFHAGLRAPPKAH